MNKQEIEKLFLPFELSKISKKKGFDQPCLAWYDAVKTFYLHGGINRVKVNTFTDAPTYDQIIDWFEQKHKIIIEIPLDQTSYIKYCIEITRWNGFADFERIVIPEDIWGLYRNRCEAVNAAIEEAFKLI